MRIVKGTERCPFCKEKIIAGATKCKHCHSDLTLAKKKRWWQKYNNFKIGLLSGTSITLIILLFIYFYFIR